MNTPRHFELTLLQLIELLDQTDFDLPTEAGPDIRELTGRLKQALQAPQTARFLTEATNTYDTGQSAETGTPELTLPQALRLVALYERTLRGVITNDKTKYQHHEARRWDEKKPHEVDGGTIFLTPRELAQRALHYYRTDVLSEAEYTRATLQSGTLLEDE